jgi:poly-beta-1,6-N-acetyl-D-glucosamine synthase
MKNFIIFISLFVFWYPLVMSTVWIIGGILFYQRREKKPRLPLTETPLVSILIPCYNEEATIENTLEQLDKLNYTNYEIIAINDGSKDRTSEMLESLSKKYEKLRVIDLKTNAGKANALYLGLIASKGEFLLGLDADAYIDSNALSYMVPHFTTPHYGERVGAVTGNPRVRNRSSLLARIQLCEFSSIISLIKRTQRLLGKVMTVSGVVVLFRKRALLDC